MWTSEVCGVWTGEMWAEWSRGGVWIVQALPPRGERAGRSTPMTGGGDGHRFSMGSRSDLL